MHEGTHLVRRHAAQLCRGYRIAQMRFHPLPLFLTEQLGILRRNKAAAAGSS